MGTSRMIHGVLRARATYEKKLSFTVAQHLPAYCTSSPNAGRFVVVRRVFFFFFFFFVSRVAKKKVCRGDGTGARNVRLPTLRAGLLARAVRRR